MTTNSEIPKTLRLRDELACNFISTFKTICFTSQAVLCFRVYKMWSIPLASFLENTNKCCMFSANGSLTFPKSPLAEIGAAWEGIVIIPVYNASNILFKYFWMFLMILPIKIFSFVLYHNLSFSHSFLKVGLGPIASSMLRSSACLSVWVMVRPVRAMCFRLSQPLQGWTDYRDN